MCKVPEISNQYVDFSASLFGLVKNLISESCAMIADFSLHP